MLHNQALIRTLRTFLQAFVGGLLTAWLASGLDVADLAQDPSSGLKILYAGITAFVVSALTWVQNALEDRGTLPALGYEATVKPELGLNPPGE